MNKKQLEEKKEVLRLERMGRVFAFGLVAVSVLMLIVELFGLRHGKADIENLFMFPAVFGFAAFVLIVMAGKLLRSLVARDENYYAETDTAEPNEKPHQEPHQQPHQQRGEGG